MWYFLLPWLCWRAWTSQSKQASVAVKYLNCCFLQAKLLGNLVHRGPDFTGEVIIPLSDGKELYLLATVLGMRGKMTPQPFAKCEYKINRGGASEASEATLTDYVAGPRDICIICASSPQANCSMRMRNGC